MKNTYEEKLNELFERIGDHAESVLATSRSNRVSARMMSVLIKDHIFYVQTDKTFRKYQDIRENPQVALCIGSIQIEGICEDIGHPLDNEEFCSRFKHHYSSSSVFPFRRGKTIAHEADIYSKVEVCEWAADHRAVSYQGKGIS